MANDMPGGAAVGVSVAVVSSGSWMMAPPVAVMQVLMGAIMCCSCLWPVGEYKHILLTPKISYKEFAVLSE